MSPLRWGSAAGGIHDTQDFFAGGYHEPREPRNPRRRRPVASPAPPGAHGLRAGVLPPAGQQRAALRRAAARDLAARLAREGIQMREAREEDYSLEDVFLVIAEKGVVAA